MNEYIIINKTAIQKRIEELGEKRKHYLKQNGDYAFHNLNSINAQLELLRSLLSQSTPLIPVLEEAYFEGECYGIGTDACINKQDYISNLKLDI